MFLLKYLSDGSYSWTTTIGNPGACSSLSIDKESDGSFFTTGFYKQTVDFDPTGCTDEHTASGDGRDAFLWKATINGEYY